jgi:hypothetical protein
MLLLFWSRKNYGCLAQDDFQDDAGADTTGNDATSDMMDTDPSLVIAPKNPGGNNHNYPIKDLYIFQADLLRNCNK